MHLGLFHVHVDSFIYLFVHLSICFYLIVDSPPSSSCKIIYVRIYLVSRWHNSVFPTLINEQSRPRCWLKILRIPVHCRENSQKLCLLFAKICASASMRRWLSSSGAIMHATWLFSPSSQTDTGFLITDPIHTTDSLKQLQSRMRRLNERKTRSIPTRANPAWKLKPAQASLISIFWGPVWIGTIIRLCEGIKDEISAQPFSYFPSSTFSFSSHRSTLRHLYLFHLLIYHLGLTGLFNSASTYHLISFYFKS